MLARFFCDIKAAEQKNYQWAQLPVYFSLACLLFRNHQWRWLTIWTQWTATRFSGFDNVRLYQTQIKQISLQYHSVDSYHLCMNGFIICFFNIGKWTFKSHPSYYKWALWIKTLWRWINDDVVSFRAEHCCIIQPHWAQRHEMAFAQNITVDTHRAVQPLTSHLWRTWALTVSEVKVMHMPPNPFSARAKKIRMERPEELNDKGVLVSTVRLVLTVIVV